MCIRDRNNIDEILVCNAYKIGNRDVFEMPASLTDYRNANPIYDKLKGWGDIPDNIWDKGFDQLPIEIKDYISFIEERIDCRVTILSVGPQRHETIIR